MTEPDGMYGEDIRHALSAMADLVVPAGDGLEKIRQRTRHRAPAVSWLFAYTTFIPRTLTNAIRVPGSELMLMAKGQSTVFTRLWAGRRRLTPKATSPQAWLRPALAAGGALVLVVAVVLAVPRLHQTIMPSAASNPGGGANLAGNNGPAGGSGQTNNATQTRPSPTTGKSGHSSPGSGGKCSGNSGSGATSTGGTGGSSPPATGVPESALLHNGSYENGPTTHCPSPSPSSHSTSPSTSSNSSSPGTPSSPTTPTSPTTPIPPSGGGTPTPTSSAISDGPSPNDSDTGS